MDKVIRAHAALFIAALLFAANYVVAGHAMPAYIEPSGFALWCVFAATVVFWIIHRFISREKIHRDDYPRFIQNALPGVAVYQLFLFNGLNLTPAVDASAMMMATPMLVVAISAFILKETIMREKIIGLLLAMAGAALLLLVPGAEWKGGYLSGAAMIVSGALGYGLFLLSARPLVRKYEAMTVVKWVFTFGCVMVFPFGYDQALEIRWTGIPAMALSSVFYVILGGTCMAWFLTVFALKTMSPAMVSIYIYLQPFFAGIICLAFGLEKWHWIMIPAGLATLTGVYLMGKTKGPISESPRV